MEILLEYFKDVNVADNSGNTALHKFSTKGDFKSSKLLLEKGANLFQENIKGQNSAEILASLGFEKLLDYIPESIDKSDLNRLLSAAATGEHLNLLINMVDKFKGDIHDCTSRVHCVLYMAISSGNLKVVNYLIENGANLNLFYQNGSPFYFAVFSNRIQIAELLLDKGADINEQAINNGHSVLIEAIRYKFNEMAEMLINRGINVNLKDKLQRTALMYAAELGNTLIGEMLLKKGAHIIPTDIFGQDAFGYTIKPKAKDFSRLLIEFGYFPKSNLCKRTVILNSFYKSLLKWELEYCHEYIQSYIDITTERMLTSTLALKLSSNLSNILPCHVTKFQNKSLEISYMAFSCYESDATVHYVFPKDDFELYYLGRTDTFNTPCRQVTYHEGEYAYCQGDNYDAITPVGRDTPIKVDKIDYGVADFMLAMVLKKMGADFFSSVKTKAISLLRWVRTDDQIILGGAKKISINPISATDLERAKKALKCIIKQLEDYNNDQKVENYKFSLQSYIEKLDELLSKGFKSEDIDKLGSEIHLFLGEMDTQVGDINHARFNNIKDYWFSQNALDETRQLDLKCYLPRFSTACLKIHIDKNRDIPSSASANSVKV